MKLFATTVLVCLAASSAFAGGEVVCTIGNSSGWAPTAPINARVVELERQGYKVTVSVPVITVGGETKTLDRLCVTLNY